MPGMAAPEIRVATRADTPAILEITRELIADGTVYPHTTDMSDEELAEWWFTTAGQLYVGLLDDRTAGVYLLKPNQIGRASHVANAAYAVAGWARGRGLGEALGRHSLEEARRLGYKAMQFNLVAVTNESAVALWKKLGFIVLCRLPKAFDHAQLGLVDTYVMHRFL
jgi:L-amino acid N-acyltransferase YncA